MVDPKSIQNYYDMTEEMLSLVNREPLWMLVDEKLKELPDLERMHRKLELNSITPREFTVLFNSYIKVIDLYISIMNCNTPILHRQMIPGDMVENFNLFISHYSRILNFGALECCNLNSLECGTKIMEFVEPPYLPKTLPDVDRMTASLNECEETLQKIVDHLNIFLERTTGKKISFREEKKKGAKRLPSEKTVLTVSEAKAKILARSTVDTELCGTIKIEPFNTADRIVTSEKITTLCEEMDRYRGQLRLYFYQVYINMLNEINTTYTFFPSVAAFIAKVDLVHSYAKSACINKYFRPQLDASSGDSYFEAKNLRHPIVEKAIIGSYVANDISLNSNGILLFGLNQVGKSTLAKAIGLNIIMAQAGCFTACQLKYRPYNKIITRLNGGDDFTKGQSSFTTEMLELRTILRQADGKTLVMGDEIAHTSETISAGAITLSSVFHLLRRKASFIFATHMHEILEVKDITDLPSEKLRICHLSVSKDVETGILQYNRLLQPGAGESVYGVMVAESLGLPKDFIDMAYKWVDHLQETSKKTRISGDSPLVQPIVSKYNPEVIVDQCALCCKTEDLHTHHLVEQQYADEHNMIDNMHVHNKGNLIVLCASCHRKLHGTGGQITATQTSVGTMYKVS
jgi:DNA mismatch repair protein MutS